MSALFWGIWVAGLLVSTVLGSYVVKKHRKYGLFVLGTFLVIYVVGANILTPRLMELKLFGMSLILVTGSFIWPYGAQVVDMINEIYGEKATYIAAGLAYAANLMFVGFAFLGSQAPAIWGAEQEEWFRMFFGVQWRVMIASMCSYTAANFVDIKIFTKIKRWAFGREQTVGNILVYSGARSILSDAVNMVIDNIVFYSVAFLGTMPFPQLLGLIGTSMIAKVIVGQIDLPFYYLFRVWTKDVVREY